MVRLAWLADASIALYHRVSMSLTYRIEVCFPALPTACHQCLLREPV